MNKIKFNKSWNWNNFYTNIALSFHNFNDKFSIWVEWFCLKLELDFMKHTDESEIS